MSNNQQSVVEGFILTATSIEVKQKSYIELWLLTEQGPVKAVTSEQDWLFFIPQAKQPEAAAILSQANTPYRYQNLPLTTFSHEPVGAVYFDSSKHFYQARTRLKQHNVTCFEDDIRLVSRYLMERFVYGSCSIVGNSKIEQSSPKCIEYSEVKVKASDYSPTISLLSLDVECSEHGELYSIGLVSQSYKSVIMIGEPEPGPEWITWVKTEKDLLTHFVTHLNAYNPDVIVGWNVVNFDFRLLIKRADLNKVSLTIGRDGSGLQWRDGKGDSQQGYVFMAGRVVLDGIDALKTATYHFDSFSLENVAQTLLGKGKDSDNVDDRLAQIQHDFRFNKVKLARYNLQDCELVIEIFEHTNLLEFLILRSQLTGLELDRMGGSVAAFVNLYSPKLHRAGYIAPNRPKDGGLASPGGYVMSSKPGLYTHVLVLDFKSLYPSIIRTFKIDPLGLIEGLKHPEDAIPGYKGAYFSRDQHFLPHIITSLWKQRDQAKQKQDAARSQAIKILMNSFYGVLGSGGCPFYDTRLASSITMRGHDIMQTTANWIEEAGHTVIYGDTDSTFVWLNGQYSQQQVREIGNQLVTKINQNWKRKIEQEYQLTSDLELEFETHFSQFLMPTIRGSEKGSKKRYAGLKMAANGEETLVFKGLETVRSDWTPLAKNFQVALYEMVFAKQRVESYVQQFIANTYAGKFDDALVYRKRIRRKLSLYVKNIPPHVRAARLADEKNKQLGKALKYQNKTWVSYIMTINGPEPLEYLTSQIDYQHYIDKQIRPVAEGILPFIGVSFESLASKQIGLF